ncbi:MAG: 4Fe-4S dicluster domain-containing protein, partial [Chloroflexota bacterium]|nr:4Fe-4S dicluster domain-containing protein [Chloroflexota bacterium]
MMKNQIPELTLDQCLKCNICVSACPVAAVTDLYPGPKYAGPQAGRFRKPDQPVPDQSVDYCSGCRVCDMVCPEGVKVAEMNARARHDLVSHGKVPALQRLRNNIIARTELLGKVAQPIAPVSNFFLSNPLVRDLTERTLGIAKEAPFPPFARERFTVWFRKREAAGRSPGASARKLDTSTRTPSHPALTPNNPALTPSNPALTPSNPALTPSNPALTPSNPA